MPIHESLSHLDYLVIGIYIISVLALGFWVSFRKKHTDDLFLAGRQLGWPNIGLSIFGTNVSPSMMIGAFAYSVRIIPIKKLTLGSASSLGERPASVSVIIWRLKDS